MDIGAHVGVFSVFAAVHSGSGRVLSYEPHPDNFRSLQENIRINGLHNVEAFRLAVAGRTGRRRLFLGTESTAHSLTNAAEDYIEVDCVTLEEALSQVSECDFLKMDCEGAEYEILFNTPPQCLRKVSKLSLEIHPLQGHGDFGVYDLKDYLEEIGFEVALDEAKKKPYCYLYAVRHM